MMKTRYYVGDKNIPWWVEKLVDSGLITSVRENIGVAFVLTFKPTKTSTYKNYLYDGDYLELDEETGAVTIGLEEWSKALASDFQKLNWDKFVLNLKKIKKDEEKKEQNEADYYSSYWS